MDSEHHGDAVVDLREDAAEVRIPRVQVHEIGVHIARIEIQAALQGAEDSREWLRACPACGIEAHALHGQVFVDLLVLIAEAPNAPLCTPRASALRKRQMRRARRAARICGRARVTGVVFWDYFHGQTGVAPNAIELHPVLGFACLSS